MALSLASSFSLLMRHSSLHMLCSPSRTSPDARLGGTLCTHVHVCSSVKQTVALGDMQAAKIGAQGPIHKPAGSELQLSYQHISPMACCSRALTVMPHKPTIFVAEDLMPECLTSSKPAFLSLVQSAKASADVKSWMNVRSCCDSYLHLLLSMVAHFSPLREHIESFPLPLGMESECACLIAIWSLKCTTCRDDDAFRPAFSARMSMN